MGIGVLLGWAGNLDGPKDSRRKGRGKKKVLPFFQSVNQMNLNTNLNSNNQKLCSSMNATKETFDSLIKIWKTFKFI
jgi:hypothetical protein